MCMYVSIIIADKQHIVWSVDAHLSQNVSKRDLMFTDISINELWHHTNFNRIACF